MASERDLLSEDVHRLGDLLGETLVEQEGRPLFDLVEEVRALAKAHRTGDEAAGERLLKRIESLPLAESRGVLKAFASYFKLVNLAEERRARARAAATRARGPRHGRVGRSRRSKPRWASCARPASSAGELAGAARPAADQPVFTAHPTEAKRRTDADQARAHRGGAARRSTSSRRRPRRSAPPRSRCARSWYRSGRRRRRAPTGPK